tara:strand:+ start:1490 stop:1675 length:186 start_codon:yes stop_codon:yes gene_type:complete
MAELIMWILLIIIGGSQIDSSCKLSVCFDDYEACFKHEQRIMNERKSNQITAKCMKLGVRE